MKATKVDGVYDKDPRKHSGTRSATPASPTSTCWPAAQRHGQHGDLLCKENSLPILVFNMLGRDNIRRVVCGEGSLVCAE